MKLITPEFEALMKDFPLYSQENEEDPVVPVKFFNPCGAGTWYLTEYNPENHLAFGYVTGLGGDELGYISLDELSEIRLVAGLTIERDLHWTPCRLSEIKSGIRQ